MPYVVMQLLIRVGGTRLVCTCEFIIDAIYTHLRITCPSRLFASAEVHMEIKEYISLMQLTPGV